MTTRHTVSSAELFTRKLVRAVYILLMWHGQMVSKAANKSSRGSTCNSLHYNVDYISNASYLYVKAFFLACL